MMGALKTFDDETFSRYVENLRSVSIESGAGHGSDGREQDPSARMLCPLPDRPRFMSPWIQAWNVQVARRVTLLCAAPVKPRNVPRRSSNGTAPAHIFITQIVRSPANQGL